MLKTLQFTAAQIAAALGITPQRIRQQLRDVSATGLRIVAGNEAETWTIDSLPGPLRTRLALVASQQHCRDVEVLLTMPRQKWEPAIPLDQLNDDVLQVATKLREALQPSMVRQHQGMRSSEFESIGMED